MWHGSHRAGRRPIQTRSFARQYFRRENDLPGVLLEVANHLIDRVQHRDRPILRIDHIEQAHGSYSL